LPFGGLQKARTLEITLPLPEKSVFFEVPYTESGRPVSRGIEPQGWHGSDESITFIDNA